MKDKMLPFTVFLDVESSRAFIDDLYSTDQEKLLKSLTGIKNTVIGSNRRKDVIIREGVLPRLINIMNDVNLSCTVRTEAVVVLGSLAKGTNVHIDQIIKSGIIDNLIQLLEEDDHTLLDASLCVLRTLLQHELAPNIAFSSLQVKKVLDFATATNRLIRQSCVATILMISCRNPTTLFALEHAGAAHVFAKLLEAEQASVRVPVLGCLAHLVYNNKRLALEVSEMTVCDIKMPQMLVNDVSRDKPAEMQLEAARCLTNLQRAGAIAADEIIITYRTLPTLIRLCQREHTERFRAQAAEVLAYLTEVDSGLQQLAAICNHLVTAMADLLTRKSAASRQAALKVFASLGANDEDIRKRIIETHRLMERVMEGLEDQNEGVRLAAVRCLHSLSRSVQQLRTTFQDHSVWKPLMNLLTGCDNPEFLSAASSALCNLLLEFSPAKEPMLQQGVIQFLTQLTSRPEPALRLNGIWALMNLAFKSDERVKSQIVAELGTQQIFKLISDHDPRVLMKTLGLLRNLVSPKEHTDTMMDSHGTQVMQAVILVLEGHHSPEVKEQALCLLANIANGDRSKSFIIGNEDILKKLRDYMGHQSIILQTTAIHCIGNLVRKDEPGCAERKAKLREIGVVGLIQELISSSDRLLDDRDILEILANLSH